MIVITFIDVTLLFQRPVSKIMFLYAVLQLCTFVGKLNLADNDALKKWY
jgi:hypothetical protein